MKSILYELDGNFWLFLATTFVDVSVAVLLLHTSVSFARLIFQKYHRKLLQRSIIISIGAAFLSYLIWVRPFVVRINSLKALVFIVSWLLVIIIPATIQPKDHHRRAFILLSLRAACHRFMSVAIALVGMIVMALPCLLIAIIMKLFTPGPVFVRQSRFARDGRTITIFKFKTKTPYESRYTWSPFRVTSSDDPRVGRLGKILRLSCLYRIPMLWNILKGDLMLFGVTPLMSEHLEDEEMLRALEQDRRRVSKIYNLRKESDVRKALERHMPLGAISYSSLFAYHFKPGRLTLEHQLNIKTYMIREGDYFLHTSFPSLRLSFRFLSRILAIALACSPFFRYVELMDKRSITSRIEAEDLATHHDI